MTDENSSPTSTTEDVNASKSALQDNIDRKGKNAYYFAHRHKANGPKWDGKIEPRLLSSSSNITTESSEGLSESMATVSVTTSTAAKALASRSLSLSKSNITNYAFTDEGSKIKIYVNLPGVGNAPDENVVLDWGECSLCLTVKKYVAPIDPVEEDDLICDTSGENTAGENKGEDRCLSFAQLFGEIENASCKKKQDKVILILKKKDDKVWSSIIA
ncbi:hypothetical protein ACHAWO_008780 [Cyclotella atomus]|uniref:CS domain-containing protein n=1 Tax=Cyclotella atomus TaxID=382360 RepID=A0ABD3PY58_9STRA